MAMQSKFRCRRPLKRGDQKIGNKVLATVNSEPWRGRDAETCLCSKISVDEGGITFFVDHSPRGFRRLAVMVDGLQLIQPHAVIDFNEFDFGEEMPSDAEH